MVEKNTAPPTLSGITAGEWQQLAQAKIYFAHMSVGFDILAGAGLIINENSNVKLNIVETTTPEFPDQSALIHSRTGKNGEPENKLAAFVQFLDSGAGNKVRLAGIKFCYVDITEKTDVRKLFAAYKNTLAALKQKYPAITFFHMTAPLVSREKGIKTLLKQVLGKPVSGYADNLNRQIYNDLIRKEYSGQAPLFDLAYFESILPDGTRQVFAMKNQPYYNMLDEYTYDGGHLTEKGKRWIGGQFLIFLANTAAGKDGFYAAQ